MKEINESKKMQRPKNEASSGEARGSQECSREVGVFKINNKRIETEQRGGV